MGGYAAFMRPSPESLPHIVVLGAGFGGLTFCRRFPAGLARLTVVDRENHHLFQPLLYQVATGGLSAPDIAQPVRSLLSDRRDTTVLLDQVEQIDLAGRRVVLADQVLSYDFLLLALGGVTSYFGHPEWEEHAPGLKSLDDALKLRRQILLAFERAEAESDPIRRSEWLTMVVVGGGPTGLELAGAFAELAQHVLRADFRHIDPAHARIILIEAGPRILPQFPPDLSARARQQLEARAVQVMTDSPVRDLRPREVVLESKTIRAGTIVWAAGVGATPLTRDLGVPVDRAGRIQVQPDLRLPGHPEVFAVGDMVAVVDAKGQPVPGVSPAAMQMAKYVSDLLTAELSGRAGAGSSKPFVYRDKGIMATIGRSAAVAKVGKLKFSGFPAWAAWLGVHLIFLIGLRNRFFVLLQWMYSYFTYRRGARIITGLTCRRRPKQAEPLNRDRAGSA